MEFVVEVWKLGLLQVEVGMDEDELAVGDSLLSSIRGCGGKYAAGSSFHKKPQTWELLGGM